MEPLPESLLFLKQSRIGDVLHDEKGAWRGRRWTSEGLWREELAGHGCERDANASFCAHDEYAVRNRGEAGGYDQIRVIMYITLAAGCGGAFQVASNPNHGPLLALSKSANNTHILCYS